MFNQSDERLELRDGDQAEFLSKRLEQYEQTLRVMYQRLTKTCPRQEEIRYDVEQLMNMLRQLLLQLLFSVFFSFQTTRALLTGSSPGFLDLRKYKLHIYFLFLRGSCEGKGKIAFHTNIRNLISKQET